MKIYLAHPFELRKTIRELELNLEEWTGHELVNPFYDIPHIGIREIDTRGLSRDQANRLVQNDYNDMVLTERQAIWRCDALVAYIDGFEVIGTFFEIWEASESGIPVYIISAKHLDHPWIKYVVDSTGGAGFRDFVTFYQFLLNQKRIS